MRTYTKIFQNKDKLAELFKLRLEGMSIPKLAKKFDVDTSSIIYQLQKRLGVDKNSRKIQRIVDKTKCPICTMLLTSAYHIKYPCKKPPVL